MVQKAALVSSIALSKGCIPLEQTSKNFVERDKMDLPDHLLGQKKYYCVSVNLMSLEELLPLCRRTCNVQGLTGVVQC